MAEEELKSCLAILDRHIDALDEIDALIGDRRVLHGSEKEKARELLREFKATLKQEIKAMEKREPDLTDLESTCVLPALKETSADFNISVNSIPSKKWQSNIYGVKISLNHYADDIRAGLEDG